MELAGKTDHSTISLQNVSTHSLCLMKQVDAKSQAYGRHERYQPT